jgi:hypothetical protein
VRITKQDMESRKRMARLQLKFSDTLDSMKDTEITYAELLIVLGRLVERWACELRKLLEAKDAAAQAAGGV